MERKHFRKRKSLILFKSQALTVKSIYRKRMPYGKFNILLRFNEIDERYAVTTNNLTSVKGIKKGDLVTLHTGNGGFCAIEKGNTIPEEGNILCYKI